MTFEPSATPLPSIVAPGPPMFRSVLFENRDLMGVSLLELNQYGFDTLEVSQDLLEETTLNCFRCEASRRHTAGSNHEGKLHALKHMTLELSSQEVGGVDPSTLFPATGPEGLNEYSGRSLVELRSEVQEMEQKLVLYKAQPRSTHGPILKNCCSSRTQKWIARRRTLLRTLLRLPRRSKWRLC